MIGSITLMARAIARRHKNKVNAAADPNAVARAFDLNIEEVLESWSISHALRELIANALDERALSGSAPIEISRVRSGEWRIRDFGRGLRIEHLTQKENPEKHRREREVLGRFGVGLKDALAVLDRKGINVLLRSRHGDIRLEHRSKANFPDIHTLHAVLTPASERRMNGTEITIAGIQDRDVEEAKSLFLEFSGEERLETTKFGDILRRSPTGTARIYVKGLVVAEEPNFAFSYNVRALTQSMRRALNRERTNVGRAAYGNRIRSILLVAMSRSVGEILADNLARIASGTNCDEVRDWADVGVRACQILNVTKHVVFVTDQHRTIDKEMVDRAIEDGFQLVTVPNTIAAKLPTIKDINGGRIRTLAEFAQQWAASIEYRFVEPDDLTSDERRIYSLWPQIVELCGGRPTPFRDLKISETMRPSVKEGMHPVGLWDPANGWVIIHRPELRSLDEFAGTLLHELVHARTGYDDLSRDFELTLTDLIGRLASRLLHLDARERKLLAPPRQPVAGAGPFAAKGR
jgi:hypothetical protein